MDPVTARQTARRLLADVLEGRVRRVGEWRAAWPAAGDGDFLLARATR
ncbi:MAG: hypothetical protein ACYSUM_10565 [Planctomycetota bacterium]